MKSSVGGWSLRRLYDVNGWLFVAPALFLISLFMIYPIGYSLWLSTQVGRGRVLSFGGFANIERLFNDTQFMNALGNTFIFLVVQVPIMLILALLLASALNNPKLRFRGVFRTMVFLPCVTSLVAYSILFRSMFALDGVVNKSLSFLGLASEPISWMTDPFWAKVLVIIALTWRWTGYNMIFFLSAMQNIDRSIYEAARVDGVPSFWRFARLTVPMLKPVILFTSVTSTIGTLQLFDEVANIFPGDTPFDPTMTLSLYIYNLSFRLMPSFGYAATVSYVIVVLVAVLSVIQFQFAKERK